MGWPVATMQYSAPTSASHALEDHQEERDTKRRKMAQQQQPQQPSVERDAMMEDEDATSAPSATSSCMTSDSEDTMDMDTGVTTATTNTSSIPPRPADFNKFNGNALSDEELVFQVDFLSSCPPSDFVM